MSLPRSRAPLAGGIFLALGPILGALLGAAQGQPSLGFVIGLGAGAALAVGVWVVDRMRGN